MWNLLNKGTDTHNQRLLFVNTLLSVEISSKSIPIYVYSERRRPISSITGDVFAYLSSLGHHIILNTLTYLMVIILVDVGMEKSYKIQYVKPPIFVRARMHVLFKLI